MNHVVRSIHCWMRCNRFVSDVLGRSVWRSEWPEATTGGEGAAGASLSIAPAVQDRRQTEKKIFGENWRVDRPESNKTKEKVDLLCKMRLFFGAVGLGLVDAVNSKLYETELRMPLNSCSSNETNIWCIPLVFGQNCKSIFWKINFL